MESAGIDPRRAIAIGDSVWDIRAARSAGIACITVESGGFSQHELSEAGAARVYRDVSELLAQLLPARSPHCWRRECRDDGLCRPGFCIADSRYGSPMTLTDTPADPPEPEPNEVPERVAPVEVPEPGIEDTPERAEAERAGDVQTCARFRTGATG